MKWRVLHSVLGYIFIHTTRYKVATMKTLQALCVYLNGQFTVDMNCNALIKEFLLMGHKMGTSIKPFNAVSFHLWSYIKETKPSP